jgi:hypothetical protein
LKPKNKAKSGLFGYSKLNGNVKKLLFLRHNWELRARVVCLCSGFDVILGFLFVCILGFCMSLRVLTRRAKMELISAEGDICSMLFPQERAQHACRLFLEHLKRRGGFTRNELSVFAWDLQA